MLKEIVDNYKKYSDNVHYGKHSRIIHGKEFIKENLNYDIQDDRCLKVIVANANGLKTKVGDHNHSSTLEEMIQIKNLFAIYDLAPRVYKAFEMGSNRKYMVVEQDYLGEWENKDNTKLIEKIKEFSEKFDILPYEQEITSDINYVDGKFVDFHGFNFKDKNKYIEELKERIRIVTHYGKNIDGKQISYQSTDDFSGKRNTDYRIKAMKIDGRHFIGKSVLDVGCNLGMFCLYAKKHGATEVLGVDKKEIINLAKEWANIHCLWDINYEAVDLNNWKPKMKYDVLFYLAVYEYFGLPEWAINCADIIYFEGHASTDKEKVKDELKKYYKEVIDLGETTDRSNRPIFKCMKG